MAFDLDKFVHSKARKAVIKLSIVGQTQKDKRGKTRQSAGSATAFFISREGYALTAAHVFYADDNWKDPGKRLYAIPDIAFVTGRIGSASAPLRIFELEETSTAHDVALIKLIDSEGEVQRIFSICPTSSRTENLTSAGFTITSGMSTPQGHITGDLDGDDYPTSVTLNPGVSGGPILDEAGHVVGLAIDGFRGRNVEGISRMLAVQFLGHELESARAREDCASTLDLGVGEEQSAKYDKLLAEANAEPNTSAARDKYEEAAKVKPEGWEASYRLAHIDFENGNFTSAAPLATKAFQSKNPSDYSLLAFAALTNDGSGDYKQAINDYRKVITNVEHEKALYRDALFSLGQVEIKLYLSNKTSANGPLLENAEENFNSFLRIGGQPTHFAFYHLACIDALNSKVSKAVQEYSKAMQALKSFRGEQRDHHIELLKSSLTASDELRPGDPVICPPLQDILRTH